MMRNIKEFLLVAGIIGLLASCDNNNDFNNIEEAILRNKLDIQEIVVLPSKTLTQGNENGQGTSYLPLDLTEQFNAVGKTSSGKTIDVNSNVVWSSSNENIATVNASGLVKTYGRTGAVKIIAEFASVKGEAAIQVSSASLSLLEIGVGGEVVASPYNVSVCTPVQFQALGSYGTNEPKRYITESVNWAVSHEDPGPPAATVDPISRVFNGQNKKGRFGAWDITSASLSVKLKATSGNISSDDLQLNITGSISSIDISPNGATFPVSTTKQFNAYGKYNSSDSGSVDFTDAALWSTGDSSIATVSSPGLVQGVTAKSTSVSVTCAGHSDSVTVTVTEAAKVERISIKDTLEVLNGIVEMKQNETVQLEAQAHYSDGRTITITKDDNTAWSVRSIDGTKPISVTNDTSPVDKGKVSYTGDSIPVGEKRFAEVVVEYKGLQDDIVVVVSP